MRPQRRQLCSKGAWLHVEVVWELKFARLFRCVVPGKAGSEDGVIPEGLTYGDVRAARSLASIAGKPVAAGIAEQ